MGEIMEEKMNNWNWYERFWKVWTVFMGIMVTSRLLRGLGLYPSSSTMIGNVMWVVIQILCVICLPLLLFEFGKGLDKERRERR